jgi:hypothetical protein
MILAFIVVAIVMPLLIAAIISASTPAESKMQPSNSYVVAIHATRVDNDTIKITHLGGEGKPLLDKGFPFLVLINGKNATNAYSLEAHLLPMTIYPESGLGYASGSSVTYSGDYVSANNSVSVLIFGNYKDGIRQNMLDVTLD